MSLLLAFPIKFKIASTILTWPWFIPPTTKHGNNDTPEHHRAPLALMVKQPMEYYRQILPLSMNVGQQRPLTAVVRYGDNHIQKLSLLMLHTSLSRQSKTPCPYWPKTLRDASSDRAHYYYGSILATGCRVFTRTATTEKRPWSHTVHTTINFLEEEAGDHRK